MTKIDVGQTIQIIANVGVIAGIVFLGVEIQQNNELLGAQARADRRNIAREANLRHLNNADLRRAMLKAQEAEELSKDEMFLLDLEHSAALTDWQYIYQEYQLGFLDEDALPIVGWRSIFERTPRMQELWAAEKRSFPPAFVEWMEQNIVN